MFESKNTAVEDMAKGVVQGMLEYFDNKRFDEYQNELAKFKQEILDAMKAQNVKSK